MEEIPFKALWVEKDNNDAYTRRVKNRLISELPKGEVLVKVQFLLFMPRVMVR